MEPALSVAWAAGIMPLATAAPAPPLEPPAPRSWFQGLRVVPQAALSVSSVSPNSGEALRPRKQKPAARRRATRLESKSKTVPLKRSDPFDRGSPLTGA